MSVGVSVGFDACGMVDRGDIVEWISTLYTAFCAYVLRTLNAIVAEIAQRREGD